MKKCLIPLLIGLMFIGLTLSVFAAETSSHALGNQNGPYVARASLPDDYSAVLSFVRKIVSGVRALLMLCAQLGCGLLGASSRAKSTSDALALSIVCCSIGMLREQVRSFLAGLLTLRKEQKEVCYG